MFTNEQTHRETEGKYIESLTATHTKKVIGISKRLYQILGR